MCSKTHCQRGQCLLYRRPVKEAHKKSNTPRKTDAMMTVMITTMVAATVSRRVGQATLLSSVTHSNASPKISSLRQAHQTTQLETTNETVYTISCLGLPKKPHT